MLALVLVALDRASCSSLEGRAATRRHAPHRARRRAARRPQRTRALALAGARLLHRRRRRLPRRCRRPCSPTGSRAASTAPSCRWREALQLDRRRSALAAAAAALAALPVALLASRYPAAWTRLLERLSFAGNALPGIVIALSLVFFAANYASPLYQTLALLVFAYVVRFLPQALAGVESSLAAVGPRVEEAARALGRGPVAHLRSP